MAQIPSFTIAKGRLKGASFVSAKVTGGPLKPLAIILHETAGPLEKGNCVRYFQGAEAAKLGVAAHIVIDRDGTVTQMVPFDKRAGHAGQSQWTFEDGKTRKLLNSCTIGIEIVGPGELDKTTRRAWFQKAGGFPADQCKPAPKAFAKSHPGQGLWLTYTPEQIAATKAVCRAIMEEYADCNEILTHYLISPGRKVDVNPLFPLEEVRRYAEGHDDIPDVPPAIITPEPAAPALVSGPTEVVRDSANQPMTVADLKGVSRHVRLLTRVRTWLFGGGLSALVLDTLGYGREVYDNVNSALGGHAWVLAVVLGLVALWVVQRLISGSVRAANEGRYVPSGATRPDNPLPLPVDLVPAETA